MKTKIKNVNLVVKFLWWCSGASSDILKLLPNEQSKYQGIGAIVVFICIMAFLSSHLILQFIFNDSLVSTFCGVLWGFIILNINRYLVSKQLINIEYYQYKGFTFFKKISAAFPKILISILISISISEPLAIRMFEGEINYTIAKKNIDLTSNNQNIINKKQIALNNLESKLIIQKSIVIEKQKELIAEISGTGGSHYEGVGPIYKIKKSDFDNSLRIRDSLELEIKNLYTEIKKEESEIKNLSISGYSSSFLNKIKTLNELTANNSFIFFSRLIITILLILIELSLIALQLLSWPGEYDIIVAKAESEKYKDTIKNLQKIIIDALDRSKINPEYFLDKDQHGSITQK